jgi:hypothetical protein
MLAPPPTSQQEECVHMQVTGKGDVTATSSDVHTIHCAGAGSSGCTNLPHRQGSDIYMHT